MQKLHPSQYGCVDSLFSHTKHSRPLIYAVLDRTQPGSVYVDSPAQPRAALVALEDMAFFAGMPQALAPDGLRALLLGRVLADHPTPYLECHPVEEAWLAPLEEALGSAIEARVVRRTFFLPQSRYEEMAVVHADMPPGFAVRVMDAAFARERGQDTAFWAPSTGRFGIAFTDAHGSVASDCFAVFVGGGMAEVAVGTEEAYRRRGLALLASRVFIGMCAAKGLMPNWACWAAREASAALAAKLGFVEAGRHTALVVKTGA